MTPMTETRCAFSQIDTLAVEREARALRARVMAAAFAAAAAWLRRWLSRAAQNRAANRAA
jgi:hypothetical protein